MRASSVKGRRPWVADRGCFSGVLVGNHRERFGEMYGLKGKKMAGFQDFQTSVYRNQRNESIKSRNKILMTPGRKLLSLRGTEHSRID